MCEESMTLGLSKSRIDSEESHSVAPMLMPPLQFDLEGRHILMSYPVFIELSITRKTEKISRKIVVSFSFQFIQNRNSDAFRLYEKTHMNRQIRFDYNTGIENKQ